MATKGKLRIVVVDDSEFSRQATVEILSDAGFDVVGSFGSAVEAMNFTKVSEADVYLIDVVMPEMSGIELAKEVSSLMSENRIIMMSSLNTENIVIESISNGAIDFLPKPFDKGDLIRAIEKICADLEKDI